MNTKKFISIQIHHRVISKIYNLSLVPKCFLNLLMILVYAKKNRDFYIDMHICSLINLDLLFPNRVLPIINKSFSKKTSYLLGT